MLTGSFLKAIGLLVILTACVYLPAYASEQASEHTAEHAIILQYHHVSDSTPAITSISTELFRWHLDYLEQNNFVIWPLSKIVRHLEQIKPLPEKCVAITFDDAYRSIYTTAFALLKEKNWPFTVFINTQAVGKGKLNLTWDEIREMAASGAEIANHSHSHAHLNRLKAGETQSQWRVRVTNDVQSAQNLIDHELINAPHASVRLFAYPYGEYSPELYLLIDSLGYAAVGQHSGPTSFSSPLVLLPRYPMGGAYTKKNQLIEKLNTYPMPVIEKTPIDPLIPLDSDSPPILKLTFAGQQDLERLKKQLQCYVSGQGKASIHWQDNTAIIQASEQLSVGRNRYNCTAATMVTENGRIKTAYYWYSQLWLKRHKDGRWYQE